MGTCLGTAEWPKRQRVISDKKRVGDEMEKYVAVRWEEDYS